MEGKNMSKYLIKSRRQFEQELLLKDRRKLYLQYDKRECAINMATGNCNTNLSIK